VRKIAEKEARQSDSNSTPRSLSQGEGWEYPIPTSDQNAIEKLGGMAREEVRMEKR
jgi:hypothetical protein